MIRNVLFTDLKRNEKKTFRNEEQRIREIWKSADRLKKQERQSQKEN